MSRLILPRGSAAARRFVEVVAEADIVFLAGLPGTGKSLLLQQLVLMALEAGRPPHLAQWDTLRQAFETPRYPIVDGATHPMVIRAAGEWLRRALPQWHARLRKTGALLIGEAPLIGGRLMEIAKPNDDAAEAILASERTRFIVPIPSRELRALIEAKRAQTIAVPQHENEAHDAPPDLLRALWRDMLQVGIRLGLADADGDGDYAPETYAAVYSHLLRHRHHHVLWIRQPLPATGSVYEQPPNLPELRATPAEAERALAQLEATQPPEPPRNWYDV